MNRAVLVALLAVALLALPASANAVPTSLEVVPTPTSGLMTFTGASARTKKDLWVAGYARPSATFPVRAIALHWNGSSWTNFVMPHPYTESDQFTGISMIPGTSEAWAVGYGHNTGESGPGGVLSMPLVEHWDGSWHAVPTPTVPGTRGWLNGVSALSATDVWAVGSYTNDQGIWSLVEHWDGSSWSIVPSPNPSQRSNAFFGVHAVSATNVWAVGYADIGRNTTLVPLIEHWQAGAWHVVKSPAINSPAVELRAVGGKGSSHVWIVGDYYDPAVALKRTLTEEFVGGKWVVVPSPNAGTAENELLGVAADFNGTVWAVGDAWMSHTGPLNTLVMRWDGTSWSIVPSASPGPHNQLMAATMVGTTLWAAGTFDDGTAWRGLVERSTP